MADVKLAKSKFFRVAVEGATATDGRTIERAWLDDIGATYNRATYGARVNMEHIRGYTPEAPFNAYGDVLAVRVQDDDIEIAGKTEKRRCLYAQVDPTDSLVALTKARQKIYTSIEVAPNFGGTGKAGLVGLACTDSPASLGTDILSFSASNPAVKAMFDGRKQDPSNLFSAAAETKIEFEAEAADPQGFAAVIAAAFAKHFKPANDNTPPEKTEAEKKAEAEAAKHAAGDGSAALLAAITAIGEKFDTTRAADQAALTALGGKLSALETKLSTTPGDTTVRPAATGATAYSAIDC